MQIISQLLERRIVPVAIVTLLAVLTLGTSAMGVAKVAGSFSQKDSDTTRVLGAEISKQEPFEEKSISDQGKEVQSNVKTTNSGKPSGLSKPVSNVSPSANGVVTKSSITPSPSTNSNACIITIFGKQYDVTSLRSTHSGGDVFACGTDQSATYQGKHGTSVARLAPYLVTSGSMSGTTTSGGSANSGLQNGSGSQQSVSAIGSSRHDDDDDDDDFESHREED